MWTSLGATDMERLKVTVLFIAQPKVQGCALSMLNKTEEEHHLVPGMEQLQLSSVLVLLEGDLNI